MEAKCTTCGDKFVFNKRWFKKNNIKKFICRKCKIIATTRSSEFRESQSILSKEKLSDENVRKRISLIAQINNIEASQKISKSLKNRFLDPSIVKQKSESVKAMWKNPEYKSKVSESIRKLWQNPDYRRKILERHQDKSINNLFKNMTKDEKDIKKFLDSRRIEYEMNFSLHIHEFSFLVQGRILVDTDSSKEKQLLINNYFKQYVLVSNLSVLMKMITY